jgi:hypothetical protein
VKRILPDQGIHPEFIILGSTTHVVAAVCEVMSPGGFHIFMNGRFGFVCSSHVSLI